MIRKIILQLCLILAAIPFTFSQSGTPVPTFGDKGTALIDFDQTGTADDVATTIKMDSKGRTIISGKALFHNYPYDGSHGTSEVVCLNPDNSLDSTFDEDGKLILPNFRINNIYITPNDKLLLVEKPNGNAYGVIRQLNSDGSPDSTFGINSELLNLKFTESLLDTNGKLILTGYQQIGDTNYFTIIRLNTDGSFDNTLGQGGTLTVISDPYARLMSADGKFLFVGHTRNINNQDDIYIIRLNMDGSADSTFNHNGKLIIQDIDYYDVTSTAVIDSTGRILIGGGSRETNISDDFFSVVRLNDDGSLDSTFHATGKLVITDISGDVRSIQFDSNGKIMLGGHFRNSDDSPLDIVRINKDGSIDSTFGINGIISLLNMVDFILDPDSKILLAGSTEIVDNIYSRDFKIVRLESNGASDPTFGDSGELIIPVVNGADQVQSMAVDASGKIVLAGYSIIGGYKQESSIARINPDGSLDSTFGWNGKKIFTSSEFNESINNVIIDSHGRILTISNVSNNEIGPLYGYITRFNYDGSADSTFKVSGELNFQYCHINKIFTSNLTDKILLAYHYRGLFDSSYYAIVRLDYDGSIDSSFGTGGKIILSDLLDFPGGIIAKDANDRIVAVGSIYLPNNSHQLEIIRLNPEGSMDSTFNNNGKQVIAHDFLPGDIVIDKDDKIFLAGFSDHASSGQPLTLARINPDGSIDSTFDIDGVLVKQGFHLGHSGNPTLSVYSGNKIFLAYSYSDSLGYGFDIESLNQYGSTDTIFGHLGKINISEGYVTSMIADSNYIWMAGSDEDEGDYKIVKLYARNFQHIEFSLPDTVKYGDLPIKLNGIATSGLPVTYTTNNPAIAYILHDTLKITEPGIVTITAMQAGDGSYYAADPVSKNLLVRSDISNTAFQESEKEIKAYPNPVLNILYLESLCKIKSVVISSVEGRMIYKKTIINERNFIIDMSAYNTGCYILTIQLDDKHPAQVRKIIKY